MPFRTPRRRIFNPLRLSDAEVEQTFIARQALLDSILGDLCAENGSRPPQHHLVVGQRGMGKTMLLCRIAAELRKPVHREKFLPLTFPEEQYIEVDRLSRFWLNCLDAAADALEAQDEHAAAQKLDVQVRKLDTSVADPEEQAEESRRAFQAAMDDLGRRPVLLLDNFHLLLKRLKKHDYVLRAFFTRRGAPVLIGAATVMPDQLQDYGAAFYDSFKTHVLHRLSVKEMREVISQLAQEAHRPDVAHRVQAELPRLQVLRELTGGNPRTTVLLFELFAQGFSDDPYEDLECLLDQVTPLYQSRLDQLSEQAQLIFSTLARHWSPATAARVTEMTHLARSNISPQLGRLEGIGLVEKTPIFPGKKTGYQIAERFFNIWYLMRFASRRQRSDLICLTRFLQGFYSPPELAERARFVLNKSELAAGEATYALALADALHHENLRHDLRTHTELLVFDQAQGIQERIAEIIDVADISPRVMEFTELKQKLCRLVPPDCPVSAQDFAAAILGSVSLLPSATSGPDRRAIAAAKEVTSEQVEEAMEITGKEIRQFANEFSEAAVTHLRDRLQRGLLLSWDDRDGLRSAIEQASIPQSLWILGDFAQQGRRYEESEQAYRKAIELDPKTAYPWYGLGNLLKNHLGRYEESEQAYRKAIEFDPKTAYRWYGLGNLLMDYLGRYDEARVAYERALELDPAEDSPRLNLAFLLRDLLGEPDSARQVLSELKEEGYGKDTGALHAALFAAYDDNWGVARESLRSALEEIGDVLPANTRDDWYRASAVLLQLGLGERLIAFLQDEGADVRLMPWFEALHAHVAGDQKHLRNIPAEARTVAEQIYHEIDRRRKQLPPAT